MGEVVILGTKICLRCKKAKLPDAFHRRKALRDGRSSWCAECKNAYYHHVQGNERPLCVDCGDLVESWRAERCKACGKERRGVTSRQWMQNNKERSTKVARARDLRKQYGLTEDEYDTILASQKNRCAICDVHVSEAKFHIDHDHVNGEVRGILCRNCNLGLGHFKDDANLFRRAIQYLHREIFRGVTQPDRRAESERSDG